MDSNTWFLGCAAWQYKDCCSWSPWGLMLLQGTFFYYMIFIEYTNGGKFRLHGLVCTKFMYFESKICRMYTHHRLMATNKMLHGHGLSINTHITLPIVH